MSEFFKAELKDRFLQYAMERDDYFEMHFLYDEFLKPNYTLGFVEKLIKEIIDYDPELLDIMSGNGIKIYMLTGTSKTLHFLNEGGFKSLYVQEEEKWDVFLDQLANTRKLSTEEKVNLGKTEKTSYTRERTILFGLIAAVAISFLFTLYSVIKTMVDEDKYMTKDEVELRLEELKNSYQSENERLKEQLKGLKNSNQPLDTLK